MYLSQIIVLALALLDEIVELGSEQLSSHVVISCTVISRT